MAQRTNRLAWLEAALSSPSDLCIVWPFSKTAKGYGKAKMNGRHVQATHLTLILSGSPRPPAPGNFALHSCDNPPCVNPRHLRWGTASENNAESFARGRTNTGEHHPMHRLTAEQVTEIRSRDYSARGATSQVAEEFGITREHVSRIRSRGRWAHVP